MKIQMNNLEALERLIGGESEVEMDIRASIVDAFCKKHLKSIANEEFVKRMAEAVKSEINGKLLVEYTSSPSYYGKKNYKLTEHALELIGKDLNMRIGQLIHDHISVILEKEDILKKLEYQLNKQVEFINDTLSSNVLEERINQMVDMKIKEKLGIL